MVGSLGVLILRVNMIVMSYDFSFQEFVSIVSSLYIGINAILGYTAKFGSRYE